MALCRTDRQRSLNASMPPKRTAAAQQGVSTRRQTRNPPPEQKIVASPPKRLRQYASSTDGSDIEIDIGEEVSQVKCKLVQSWGTSRAFAHVSVSQPGVYHRRLHVACHCKNSSSLMTTWMSSKQVSTSVLHIE